MILIALYLIGLIWLWCLCRAAKQADEVEPMRVIAHDPEMEVLEDMDIPTFIRHLSDPLPRPRKERE